MSVIFKDKQKDKIFLITKGADSIIIPRLSADQNELANLTNNFLDGYA